MISYLYVYTENLLWKPTEKSSIEKTYYSNKRKIFPINLKVRVTIATTLLPMSNLDVLITVRFQLESLFAHGLTSERM